MNDKQAVKQLKALKSVSGALRIITNEHNCGGGTHPRVGKFSEAKCAAFEHPMTDPRHFVIHEVTSIEGPNRRGQYRAFTEAGDHCTGQPVALLSRLLEAGKGIYTPPSDDEE